MDATANKTILMTAILIVSRARFPADGGKIILGQHLVKKVV
jgi:hypothetical protein